MISSKVQSRRARARFLAQSIQLEECDVPGVFGMAVFSCALLFGGGIAWASVTPVEELASSPGQVIPSGHHHLVQHLEGGIVEHIAVRDGDRVQAGQVLARLSPVVPRSELAQARSRLADLEFKLESIDALLMRREPQLEAAGGSAHPALAAKQLALYHSTRESQARQLAVIDSQIRQREAERDGLRRRAAALGKQYALLAERRAMFQQLEGSGTVAAADLLTTRAREAEVQADFEQVNGSLDVTERAITEAKDRYLELEERLHQELLAEQARIEAERMQARESVAQLSDRLQRLEVRASVAGIVQDVQVNTVNQVLRPGQTLLEIVPVGDQMVVQSRISPGDIGHVRVGQPAKVAVDSFDVSRFGDISGAVRHISPSTFLDDTGLPYYEVEIALSKDHVGHDPSRHRLVPGMTVQADVVTGEKTVLDYLLKPVYRGFNSAFRER